MTSPVPHAGEVVPPVGPLRRNHGRRPLGSNTAEFTDLDVPETASMPTTMPASTTVGIVTSASGTGVVGDPEPVSEPATAPDEDTSDQAALRAQLARMWPGSDWETR